MIKPSKRKQKPTEALLSWYDAHRRDLPWRAPPGQRADPYAVWLSEIMLQQTTVATVRSYYERFLARWPRVEELAAASLDDVLAQWAGLGYYARARNLHACARVVADRHFGLFPREETSLLCLPGVGPYTAAAVSAIAFDEPCVAIDGNVERVISRIFAIETPVSRAKPLFLEKAREILSRSRPGDFAQAMMDLGATICTPRSPDCSACPLTLFCAAHRMDAMEKFPVREKAPPKPRRRGAIFVLTRGDDVLLRRRPPNGLLGGMNAFPSTPLTQDVSPEEMRAFAPCAARWRPVEATVLHVFTHFTIETTVFLARTARTAPPPTNCRWAARDNLDKEGLPTLMRKVAMRAGLIERLRAK